MIVIGITGTLGAGKGTIVEYLVKKHQFRHYSARQYLAMEAKQRGVALNRDTYVQIANDLRAQNSPSFIIDELYREAKKNGENAIIESIRTVGEVNSLRQHSDFTLWAIDALPEERYKRIVLRNSETDKVSQETFIANEKREMNTANPTQQNLAACIELADHVLNNDGNFDQLYYQIDNLMKNILLNQ